ncbi:PH domain-containing protein [Corynebacterium kefirresidentii]|uniref:PH domain-containing protein n=1 Tax=Corynebacterium kefirresidentii TaxID=1979527 RepID=UPI000A3CF334|nr:PH domain-containing protein [Corynebacterium kefirresidentii]OUJ22364.1 hypothetical protein CBI45_09265 [Corynebacterium kefirresidentii]
MDSITRSVIANEQEVLNAAHQFALANFKKYSVNLTGNELAIHNKFLWQSQDTSIVVENGVLTASHNTIEAMGRSVKIIQAIDSLLDDQGWNEAIRKTGANSVKSPATRDRILALLYPDETVIAATQGLSLSKTSIIAATDRRVLLVKADTFGFDSGDRSISLEKISSVSTSRGLAFASIELTTSNEEIKVEKVANNEADGFVRELRARLDSASEPVNVSPVASDNLDQLTKLADLHAAGVLTDEEFAAAKAKALGL